MESTADPIAPRSDPLAGTGRCALSPAGLELDVDTAEVPLDALYAAAYPFIDRCYVLLDAPVEGRVRVRLAPRRGILDSEGARALAAELAEELVGSAWRSRVIEEQRLLIEAIALEAYDTEADAVFTALASFDLSSVAFDDPLGIAVTWEERYAKKTPPPAEPVASDGAGEPTREPTREDGA